MESTKNQTKEPQVEEEPKENINQYVNYEQNQFNDFLRKLMDVESKIEDAKISLAINPDFNCEDAFRIFESNDKGFLTKEDLKEGLNLIGIYPTGKKLKLSLSAYSQRNHGRTTGRTGNSWTCIYRTLPARTIPWPTDCMTTRMN